MKPLMIEQWKDIPGYEGLYEISDLGRVRRILKRGGTRMLTGLHSETRGCRIDLSRGGVKSRCRLARLVLMTFCPIRDPYRFLVRFANDDPDDCCLENLSWIPWGDLAQQSPLTSVQVCEIKALWRSSTLSYRAIGRRYHVSHATIGNIINDKSWKHVTDDPVTQEVSDGE